MGKKEKKKEKEREKEKQASDSHRRRLKLLTDPLLRGEKRRPSFKETDEQILQLSGETSDVIRGGVGVGG